MHRRLETAPAFLLLPLLTGAAKTFADPPQPVATDVSSVAHGMPTYNDPTIIWASLPGCSNTTGDELLPALFVRTSNFRGVPARTLLSFNPFRPVAACNPYRLLSDLVVDESSFYYLDNQGPGGHPALWRRSRLANEPDSSALLVDLGESLTSGELLLYSG